MNATQFPTLLAAFCVLLERQQAERMVSQGLNPALHNHKVRADIGRKFAHIVCGTTSKFMVEVATGNIFGTKGVQQVHRGHFYGTLETTGEYFWCEYYPSRLDGKLKKQKGNSAPVITHAPAPVAVAAEPVMEQMDLASDMIKRMQNTPAQWPQYN